MQKLLVSLMVVFVFLLSPYFFLRPSHAGWDFGSTNFSDIFNGVSCGDANLSAPNNKCCQPFYFNADPKLSGVLEVNTPVGKVDVTGPLNSLLSVPAAVWNVGFAPVANIISKTLRFAQGKRAQCTVGDPSTNSENDPQCKCLLPGQTSFQSISYLCDQIKSPTEKKDCTACVSGDNPLKKGGIWTGIGCVYGDMGSFIQNTLLGWMIGLAGAAALFCIIYASFMMQISQGNAEKIKKAQELLTSCIMGLILIIFSTFILRVIGVDILRIPGFR